MADYSNIKSFLKRIREEGLSKEARDAAGIGLLTTTAMESIARNAVCTCLNGICAWHIANELVQTIEEAVSEAKVGIPTRYSEYDDCN